MDIRELIDTCNDILDSGNCDDNVSFVVETFFNMLEPIAEFVEETGTDCTYPMEYWSRNKGVRATAVEAFAKVLEALGEY